MAAQQVFSGTPGGEYNVIDAPAAANGIAVGLKAQPAGAPGYDDANNSGLSALPASQGKNAFSNGNVLVDTTNDYSVYDPSRSTVSGNPTQNTPTSSSLSTVVLNTQNVRLVFKNPA